MFFDALNFPKYYDNDLLFDQSTEQYLCDHQEVWMMQLPAEHVTHEYIFHYL